MPLNLTTPGESLHICKVGRKNEPCLPGLFSVPPNCWASQSWMAQGLDLQTALPGYALRLLPNTSLLCMLDPQVET